LSERRTRKIIHIDMDAFYASVEQRDDPALRGRPVIVGGNPGSRGVVAACSYEARRFGVHSAMPSARAARLCPDAVFLRPRFDAYRAESVALHAIFGRYTAAIEPLSLDEAYLDVTGSPLHGGSATRIAEAIRADIRHERRLTASAGVSYNKFLAKIASDLNKPDGIAVILPEQAEAFVAELPVRRFHGIGPATAARMNQLGIHTGADLRGRDELELIRHFGRAGRYYHRIARGIDERPVSSHRVRKSLGAERTFAQDLASIDAMHAALRSLADDVGEGLARRRLVARTITLKVRYHDFRTVTRSHTGTRTVQTADALYAVAEELLQRTEAASVPVRLLGVSASSLIGQEAGEPIVQYALFDARDCSDG
jgi:DNA polymerase IV